MFIELLNMNGDYSLNTFSLMKHYRLKYSICLRVFQPSSLFLKYCLLPLSLQIRLYFLQVMRTD